MRDLNMMDVKAVSGAGRVCDVDVIFQSEGGDQQEFKETNGGGGGGSSFGSSLQDIGDDFINAGKSAAFVGAGLTLVDGPLPIGDILGVPAFFAGGSLAAVGGIFVGSGELINMHSGN